MKIVKLSYSIRPSACFGAGLLAVAGGSPAWKDWLPALITFCAVFFGSAACFLINDLFDKNKDLINGKKRPIAIGELPPKYVWLMTSLLLGTYLLLSVLQGLRPLIICVITIVVFFAYSPINNRLGLSANVLVAFMVCLAVIYGGYPLPLNQQSAPVLVNLTLVIIAREILLDALDIKGDRAIGKTSIPIELGDIGTRYTMAFIYVLLSLISAWMIFNTSAGLLKGLLFALILSIWIPFTYSIKVREANWQLFNVRSSHLPLLFIVLIIWLR